MNPALELIGMAGLMVRIGYVAVLVIGYNLSRRAAFKEGWICFLLLLLLELNSYVAPLYMTAIIDNYANSPGKLSLGHLIGAINSLLLLIESAAIGLLVWGLYRRLRRPSAQDIADSGTEQG